VKPSASSPKYDACVVGGAGHVGAPLAILLAETGLRVLIQDLNEGTMAKLEAGEMPFLEEGGEEGLRRVLKAKKLGFSASAADIKDIPFVIITIGTPVDEFQNPEVRRVTDCIDALLPHLSDSQTLVLRSTVFPGVTDYLHRYLEQRGKHCKVAFCPERVVQGFAIREMRELPQIVSGTTKEAEDSAAELFSRFAPKIVRMVVMEAEFAKLFANAYRYIQFAAANQFYMMVDEAGLDYSRMLEGLKSDYPRLRDLPAPGFAAGPCLYKDTLQLAAFAKNHFGLGYAALQVNEGLPAYVVGRLAANYSLPHVTVGLLGMAFKAESDDTRSSLSYKLKRLLRTSAKDVLTTDPFVTDDSDLRPLNDVIERSDVLVLCVPHKAYKNLDLRGRPLVDIWNFHEGPAQAPTPKLPPKKPSGKTVGVG
jgi:UDP-N-acetyl-D-mannosaminuronic acid dehydrogenase